MSKIFDSHSHFMPPEVAQNTTFYKVHWSDIEGHLKIMDEKGIEKSLLLYPTSDAHLKMGGWANVCRVYNQGLSDVIKKYPSRFSGAGILPLDNLQNLKDELHRLRDLGFKVISLPSSYEKKYLDHEFFHPIYDFAKENRLTIHVHSQIIQPIGEERIQDPLLSPVLEYVFDVSMCIGKLMMEGVFSRYPDVNFIFAHYGGVLPFVKERFDNTYLMLRKRNFVKDLGKIPSEYFKNLYLDTSGSCSWASLLCALEVTDSNHVLFGSDYPANQQVSKSISIIQDSTLSVDQKAAIFGKNLEKLL